MSIRDEGYIKFEIKWEKAVIEPPADWEVLNNYRTNLFDRGLVGMYDNGIGFGNVSMRLDRENQFLISGTQTGHKRVLALNDYSRVTQFDIEQNRVWCRGLAKASSETLTHAAIYQAFVEICFVFHIHDCALWKQWKGKWPTTSRAIAYGTPQMAYEIQKTLNTAHDKPVIMGGHEEGILLYGRSATAAFAQLDQP